MLVTRVLCYLQNPCLELMPWESTGSKLCQPSPSKNYASSFTQPLKQHILTFFSTLVTITVPQSFYLSQKCIFPVHWGSLSAPSHWLLLLLPQTASVYQKSKTTHRGKNIRLPLISTHRTQNQGKQNMSSAATWSLSDQTWASAVLPAGERVTVHHTWWNSKTFPLGWGMTAFCLLTCVPVTALMLCKIRLPL